MAEQIENLKPSLRPNIQLFAESATGGEGGATEGGSEGNNATDNTAAEEKGSSMSTEALDRLIQSRVDTATAALGKEIANLRKENTKLKNEGKTVEEIKNREIADRDKALTEREQALLERENRLFAIKAIKEAELDSGDAKSLELAETVIAGATSEEEITKRVQNFKSLVNSFVEEEVTKRFKQHGRTPNGAKNDSGDNSDDTSKSVAEKIGKERAAREKHANDVLSMYTKRR